MKKIEYDNTVAQMREVIALCKSLTQEQAKNYDLSDLSAVLNRYFPENCTATAPDRVAWEAARNHLNTFVAGKTRRAWYFNPYLVTLLCGLVIAAVTVFIFQPWQSDFEGNVGAVTNDKSDAAG